MAAEGTWKPRGRDDVVFRKTGDDWLLYDPVTDDLHVLNLSAALVWSLCTGDLEPDEIRDDVLSSFEDPEADLDIDEILDDFQSAGLLSP